MMPWHKLPGFIVRRYGIDRYGDYHFMDYPGKRGLAHGYSYCYFRRGDSYRLLASLDERPGYTVFKYDSRAGLLEIFAGLAERGERSAPQEKAPAQGVKTAIDYIRGHYRQQITIGELARLTHMSEGHFCRLFKKYTFKTPVQYVNRVRLSAAMELLLESDRKVLDVALDTGFNSLSYFIGVFKESMGCTPTEFRRRQGRPETLGRDQV